MGDMDPPGSGASECAHDSELSVFSSGLDRVVCEICGDVSFTYTSSTPIDLEALDPPGSPLRTRYWRQARIP
jgi:hypothetical protein